MLRLLCVLSLCILCVSGGFSGVVRVVVGGVRCSGRRLDQRPLHVISVREPGISPPSFFTLARLHQPKALVPSSPGLGLPPISSRACCSHRAAQLLPSPLLLEI